MKLLLETGRVTFETDRPAIFEGSDEFLFAGCFLTETVDAVRAYPPLPFIFDFLSCFEISLY
jgi:hypothetical protein